MTARKSVVTAGIVVVTVVLCMLFVDRPVAQFTDSYFRNTVAYATSSGILHPLDTMLIVGPVIIVIAGVWATLAPAPPRWVRRFASAGVAAVVALIVTELLKFAIGRSQVDAYFTDSHVYDFQPFKYANRHGAFPSATMSISSAFFTALGLTRGWQRALGIAALVVFAVALLVVNGHWLSDIIGGTYLGLMIGEMWRYRAAQRQPTVAATTAR